MKRYATIAICIATLLPAGVFAAGGHWAEAVVAVLAGVVWLAGLQRGWGWAGGFGAFVCTVLALWGAFIGLTAALMLIGVVAMLCAWDLYSLALRLGTVRVMNEQAIIQGHLRYLGIVATLGLVLGGIALAIRAEIGFGWLVALALVGIMALARFVKALGA